MSEWEPDPILLKTFLAVRRHGNLTRAAEELFVTQPAVSRRIGRLERSLGLPLFERLGKSIDLTEAGEALAKEAAALLGSAARLAEAVRARRSGEEGRLRIGASTTPGLYLLPAVVRRFQSRYPRLEVRYAIENSLHIEEKLVRNDLDLALVGAHLTHAALSIRPVHQDEIVFYAGAVHPLGQRRTIGPKDLEGSLCVGRESGSATRRLVEKWLRRVRAHLGRTMEIGCPEAAKVLVRAGIGISYMSRSGLRGEGGRGLRRLTIDGPAITRPIFLVSHRDKRISPPMRAFIGDCEAALAALDDGEAPRPRRREAATSGATASR
jgi:DNA-binding transcriptional LysR family regulator